LCVTEWVTEHTFEFFKVFIKNFNEHVAKVARHQLDQSVKLVMAQLKEHSLLSDEV
jgi:hypothetical protein